MEAAMFVAIFGAILIPLMLRRDAAGVLKHQARRRRDAEYAARLLRLNL
jgi:hypothetical protein